MTTNILFSGSKGNCTYISDGTTGILVDAGGTLKKIRDSLEMLGTRLENIKGIFVTHEHSDHIMALYTMCKKYNIRIYTSVETARAFCTPSRTHDMSDCRNVARNVMTVKPDKTYEVGTLLVKTFSTPHDTEGSLGYIFKSSLNDKTLAYATDIGHVTEDMRTLFRGIRNFVIESNHDIEMLKNGPYPEYLKERILSERGHLSNKACAEFIRELAECGGKSFALAHLSEENNMPTLALEEAEKALEGYEAVVRVASAYKITNVEMY